MPFFGMLTIRDRRAFLVSCSRAPAFMSSRVPGVLGTQASGNANFIQERGTQKNRNAKFAFLLRDDTVMTCTERRGGRGGLWTRYEFDPKPASRQYTRTPRTRDEGGLMAS